MFPNYFDKSSDTTSTNIGSPLTMNKNVSHNGINNSQTPASNTSNNGQLKEETKPLEMNTYIQLEIDSNNFNCVPRVCKFCITKLNIQDELVNDPEVNQSKRAVLLAVKLQVSKRSLRSIEIPLTPNSNSFALDLNLNYSITYPHFLKKDTNFLYFYIQERRKKSKGYKTLAFTFIDLASVLQRPFSKDLPLIQANNLKNSFNSISEYVLNSKSPNSNQSNENRQLNASNSNNMSLFERQTIGYIRIQSLVSHPLEIMHISTSKNNTNKPAVVTTVNGNSTNNTRSTSKSNDNKKKTDNSIKIKSNSDKKLLKNRRSLGTATAKPNSAISDSDNELENGHKKHVSSTSNSKKLTGKIISFIRKLRNENLEEEDDEFDDVIDDEGEIDAEDEEYDEQEEEEEEEEEDEHEEPVEHEYEDEEEEENEENETTILQDDFDDDMYDIEQVSDYTDDSDSANQDAYSIVSTPKPKLQPFFSNSNPSSSSCYLETNNDTLVDDNLNTTTVENYKNKPPKSRIQELIDSKLNLIAQNQQQQVITLILIDESDPFFIQITNGMHQHMDNNSDFIFITKLNEDLALMNEIIMKWFVQNRRFINLLRVKLVLILNDLYLNKYLQIYLDLIRVNSDLPLVIRHYFIPRQTGLNSQSSSLLSKYLSRLSLAWTNLFMDDNEKDISLRILKYINAKDVCSVCVQIGEVMLTELSEDATPKFIPFLSDVRIGFNSGCKGADTDECSNLETHVKQGLSTSNSLPQFTNLTPTHQQTIQNNGSPVSVLLSKADRSSNRYSPPLQSQSSQSSPGSSPDEIGFNLQLDFWTWSHSSNNHSSSPPHLNQNGNSLNGSESVLNTQSINLSTSGVSKDSSRNSRKTSKSSVKALFKSLNINRTQLMNKTFHSNDSMAAQSLSIIYVIKEKKQKIMRIGKKSKDSDYKKENVDSVTRLVCTSRNHNTPLNVFIDDLEYNNVKFLQISSLWQGKIKLFNVTIPNG